MRLNPFDFTVSIHDREDGGIVGTGVVVARTGLVVTCLHVVSTALGRSSRRPSAEEKRLWFAPADARQRRALWVYFPQLGDDEAPKMRRAHVCRFLPDRDDDIVLLQVEKCPPLDGRVAPLGAAERSFGREFVCYGYSPRGRYESSYWRDVLPPPGGTIDGPVDGGKFAPRSLPPIHLSTPGIDHGMSGAGIFDPRRGTVVGFVSHFAPPSESAYAVDARVLFDPPFSLVPASEAEAAPPRPDSAPVAPPMPATALPRSPMPVRGLPQKVEHWVERRELCGQLDRARADPSCRLIGLVGFGGEGKSTLARHWVATLPEEPPERLAGVFWHDFNQHPSVASFFAGLAGFLGFSASSHTHSQFHSALGQLIERPYVLILDGLEARQHRGGDQAGRFDQADLKSFLLAFDGPAMQSRAVLTSRLPLKDLMGLPAYREYEVGGLPPASGRDLLRALGVGGADADLERLAAAWGGHALSLDLLAGGLRERNPPRVLPGEEDAPRATAGDDRVARVLAYYPDTLGAAQRDLLGVLSLFRRPIPAEAAAGAAAAARRLFPSLAEASFDELARPLRESRLLRCDAGGRLTLHPVIRDHFARAVAADEARAGRLHAHLAAHYLARGLSADGSGRWARLLEASIARLPLRWLARWLARPPLRWLLARPRVGAPPRPAQVEAFVELVHHFCRAGGYEEAWKIGRVALSGGDRWSLATEQGALDTALSLLCDFAPAGDLRGAAELSRPADRHEHRLLEALCLTSLGRLAEAHEALTHARAGVAAGEADARMTSLTLQTEALLAIYRGRLRDAVATGEEAASLARAAGDADEARNALVGVVWAERLLGRGAAVLARFEADPKLAEGVFGYGAVHHAECLLRGGRPEQARRVAAAGLVYCRRVGSVLPQSQLTRLLGQAAEGGAAAAHLDAAVDLARGITFPPVLLEALQARGRWAAREGRPEPARRDLDEADRCAMGCGYRVYAIDIRVGRAWARLAAGDSAGARQAAEEAAALATEIDYAQGRDEAAEVLQRIGA